MPKYSLHGRALVSLSMLAGFLIVSVSGIVLFLSPAGRMAQELGWDFWGLTKGNWRDLHILFGFVFILGGLIHLFLNIKPITKYIYDKTAEQPCEERRAHINVEALLILLLAFLLFVSAVNNTPPASYLNDLRQNAMKHWQSDSDRNAGGIERGATH